MFKAGALLTFLATLLACVCVLILENVSKHSTLARVLGGGVGLTVYIFAFIGLMACILPSFQLGLDQMPDASPANITSFISWAVFHLVLDVGSLIFCTCISCSSIVVLRIKCL